MEEKNVLLEMLLNHSNGGVSEMARDTSWKTWPKLLAQTFAMALHHKLPMQIIWGVDEEFYFNDATIFLFNHLDLSGAFGKPLAQIYPQLSGIIKSAHSRFSVGEDVVLQNFDKLEAINFNPTGNICLSPLRDEGLELKGVLITWNILEAEKEPINKNLSFRSREGHLHFMLDYMPQHLWTTNSNGELDFVNQKVCEDFGVSSVEEIIENGWESFVHPEDLVKVSETWQAASDEQDVYQTEFRLKFSDGNYYWHLVKAIRHLNDMDETSWVGTSTNIHDQKMVENQKNEFISIASHELKTPLTTIKALFQLTLRDFKNDTNAKLLLKGEQQVNRLQRLIDNLLDVAKINAGKMVYQNDVFEFSDMITDAVEAIQTTVSTHQIKIGTNDRFVITGDIHRLEQVLVNLLTNAIKYSPEANEVVVTSEVEGNNAIVCVSDSGIGIPEEKLKGLFDRFYRIDNTSKRFEGLGLGLFIAADIIKRHGGSFWIESTVGVGSKFLFLLPLHGKQLFKEIESDDKTYYIGDFIKIYYRKEQHFLDVEWLGYQNYDSVVKGCWIMLDLMQKNNCSSVLNDNTLVKGNWSEASDWGASVWFPAMATAGLKKFAWVYSPSTFSRIAANVSLPNAYDEVQVAFFDHIDKAKNWLLR